MRSSQQIAVSKGVKAWWRRRKQRQARIAKWAESYVYAVKNGSQSQCDVTWGLLERAVFDHKEPPKKPEQLVMP